MPSPFPGMDPYLEHPAHWPSIHHQLITWIGYQLAPALDPDYFVAVEERVVVVTTENGGNGSRRRRSITPDVSVSETEEPAPARSGGTATLARAVPVRVPLPEEVSEPYIEIRDLRSGGEVVTVVEVLSPTNKRAGEKRTAYLLKRNTVLASTANLVEIDLLRSGSRMPVLDAPPSYDYSVLVSRKADRDRADFYPFTVRDPIPIFPVPLRPGEPQPTIHLRQALDEAYDRGRLHLAAQYNRPPTPPLSPAVQAWANELLAAVTS